MRILYHYNVCPFSRKVRLLLSEKKLDFTVEAEKFWTKRPEFLKLNPAGQVPVLVDLNGFVISDSQVICDYLDEVYTEKTFLGATAAQRAETRRLIQWFDLKFAQEVSLLIMIEKTLKRHFQSGPQATIIRQAKANIHHHLEYISFLTDRRKWLAGDDFSLADLTAAAHLSVVDYLGDVPWDKHPVAKDWYMRLKSRPSFRGLLQDKIAGIKPAEHYENLDF
ncbi:MAG TPA: glutathione S-transferase family protein [Alphaproteobacteria bacterium]|nr:glutathione S-transferase family protein [Alphaproteobacteria bacterium]